MMWKLDITLCALDPKGELQNIFTTFVGKTANEVNKKAGRWISDILKSGYIIHSQHSEITNMTN